MKQALSFFVKSSLIIFAEEGNKRAICSYLYYSLIMILRVLGLLLNDCTAQNIDEL